MINIQEFDVIKLANGHTLKVIDGGSKTIDGSLSFSCFDEDGDELDGYCTITNDDPEIIEVWRKGIKTFP